MKRSAERTGLANRNTVGTRSMEESVSTGYTNECLGGKQGKAMTQHETGVGA